MAGRRTAKSPPPFAEAEPATTGKGTVQPAPRLAILAAMPTHEDGLRVTVVDIAKAVSKHPSTIDQSLWALQADGLVEFHVVDGIREWFRTAVPIPQTFTSTATAHALTHDARALRKAMGEAPPPLVRGGRVIRR